MIKIVFVDINEEWKEKIANLISSHKDLMIQGMGKDNYDAIRLVKKFQPDIALLGANLGLSDGIEISYILKRCSPSTEIVIFSSRVEDRLIQGMINGKITGCLLLTKDLEYLAVILRSIHRGEFYVNSLISARAFEILASLSKEKIPDSRNLEEKYLCLPGDFSRAEFKILKFLSDGCTSKDIANSLGLKQGTVRNYISSIMKKAGLKTRTQVVLYALQNGLGKGKGNELARDGFRP